MRNKSEGQILKKRHTVDQDSFYPQFLANTELFHDSPEELGYVSDVCDYNVRYSPQSSYSNSQNNIAKPRDIALDAKNKEEPGVIHGKLSLSIAPEESTVIKVDNSTRVFQRDDPYTRSQARSSQLVRSFVTSLGK